MTEKINCVLLVQKELKDIVHLSQKCIDAGVDENVIFATVSGDDITRFLNTKNIATIIIDADLYNLGTASIIQNHAINSNLNIVIVKSEFIKKTIRMMMDKNLKYISPNMNIEDLAKIIIPDRIEHKKVVHL